MLTGAPDDTLVIAHRGDWAEVPENTLESFERAVRVGADMIELDVRRTADGRLIAYHDAEIDGVPVNRLRHDELRAKGGRLRPPLLEEVVRQLANRIALNLELKERGCAAEAVALLRRHGVERCLLTSFLADVVRESRACAPEFQTGLIVSRASTRAAISRTRRLGADCLVLELELADDAALAAVAAQEIPCLVWTVNEAATIDRCLRDPAVVGVVTDRPGLALHRRACLSGRSVPAAPS